MTISLAELRQKKMEIQKEGSRIEVTKNLFYIYSSKNSIIIIKHKPWLQGLEIQNSEENN